MALMDFLNNIGDIARSSGDITSYYTNKLVPNKRDYNVWTSYTYNAGKTDEMPKGIVKLVKLIETLESEGGGEEIKALITKKMSEIRELEAVYDFVQVIVKGEDEEEKEDQDGNKFKLVFHHEGQRYYAEGSVYDNKFVILQETSDSDNGKGIKNGCVQFKIVKKDNKLTLTGVVQTTDNEIINISQTLA